PRSPPGHPPPPDPAPRPPRPLDQPRPRWRLRCHPPCRPVGPPQHLLALPGDGPPRSDGHSAPAAPAGPRTCHSVRSGCEEGGLGYGCCRCEAGRGGRDRSTSAAVHRGIADVGVVATRVGVATSTAEPEAGPCRAPVPSAPWPFPGG